MPLREVSGHRHLLELLARAVGGASLPQSLIFSGPERAGKRTTALALAQAVNCERPVAWPDVHGRDACGTCNPCRRIARGVHADVLVVEPEDSGSIKIEQVRDAIDRASYRPFEGRRRFVIIDDAQAMVAPAQDALLKTLEEPPSASVFVLVTSVPDTLMPTIRSRCQRLRFGPVMESEAADEEAAARDAAVALLSGVAGTTDPRRRLDRAKVFAATAPDRDEMSRRLTALLSLVRDLSLLGAHVEDRALANVDLKPQLTALLKTFDRDRALGAFETVDRAIFALSRNASPKIVADWVALHI